MPPARGRPVAHERERERERERAGAPALGGGREIDRTPAGPFPRASEEDDRLFQLLNRAYIEARDKRSDRVTAGDLTTLGERVRDLASRVERACRAGIGAPAPVGGEGAGG
ncbi:MAG TPA: hypothetical protein VFS43_13875 [Polyangiaceae bacterium]|nr:hypothetical protein [Polyangiaceae bacterium]